MKNTYIFIITLSMLFLATCKNEHQKNDIKNKKLTEFWMAFNTALNNNDIVFLTNNSSSKIQCGNCRIEPDSTEWFGAKEFYTEHVDKIKPPFNKEYDISYNIKGVLENNEGQLHRINYPMKAKESYNIIYTIIEKEEQFLFHGMFTVP